MKKKVLILAGYYIPSIKAGGPVQSIKNLIDNLHESIDFYVVALDKDLGENKEFPNLVKNEWVKTGNAKVFYINEKKLNFLTLRKIINSVNYDILYLNSFFSYKFSILPILLYKINQIKRSRIIIAPRGGFSKGALDIKSFKKKAFINVSNMLNLSSSITWHATANLEKEDIESIFGHDTRIVVANNLTANYKKLIYTKNLVKTKDYLDIVFISRIHPKKNLKKAIEFLYKTEGNIHLNIFGPIEDKNYWDDCKELINKLPQNVKVTYKGLVKNSEVIDVFKSNHIFLFPTLGENFGHVISEALIGGCPVILSDQTPWRNLEQNLIGWDIELHNEEKFIEVLKKCVEMDDKEYQKRSRSAFDYGKESSNNNKDIRQYKELFEVSINS